MKGKTILASMVTLTFLCGFVFATVAGLALSLGDIALVPALALGVGATIVWSFLVWLVSPLVMDLVQRWVGSECAQDSDCNFDRGQCRPNPYGHSFCTMACSGSCAPGPSKSTPSARRGSTTSAGGPSTGPAMTA